MSDLQVLINSPIGALFFVSGTISVLVLLAIFILKKGSELHSILGYLFFFGLCFANYSAAVSYYEGYLPLAAIGITIPVSTISTMLSLGSIIPTSTTLVRIRIHIVSSCVSTTSVCFGTMINWYHFNVVPLDISRWDDFIYMFMLSMPIMIVGGIIGFYFLLQSSTHFERIANSKNESKLDLEKEELIIADTRNQTILVSKGDKDPIVDQFGLKQDG